MAIFQNNGTLTSGVVSADLTTYNFIEFELKIVGFGEADKDTSLALGAYVCVTDGEGSQYYYMQAEKPTNGEKYSFVTYNQIMSDYF